MAEGKKIEIRMAAIGGDKAAEEITKVADAASEMEKNVSNIGRVQQAQAISELSNVVGRVGGKFLETADSVEEFDKELADTLRNAGRGIDSVSSGLSTIAMGFAVGGPIGAAAGALTVIISEVGKAWMESEREMARASERQKLLFNEQEDAAREARQEIEATNDEIANAAVLNAIKNTTEAAKEFTTELERQVSLTREKRRLEDEFLDAKDRSELAKVDLDETTGKLSGVDAAKKRSEIEAASRKREREERKRQVKEDAVLAQQQADAEQKAAATAMAKAEELAAKKEKASRETSELKRYLEGEKPKMVRDENGKFTPNDQRFIDQLEDEIDQAEKLLSKLEDASDKAKKAADDASTNATTSSKNAGDAAKRAEQTVRTVDAVQREDDRRLKITNQDVDAQAFNKAKEQAEKKAKADQRKKDDAERKAKSDADKLASEQAKVGRDAVSLIPKNVTEKARAKVEAAAARLQDGAQGEEMQKMLGLVEFMANYIEKTQGKESANAIKIAQLEDRIKNLRNPGTKN